MTARIRTVRRAVMFAVVALWLAAVPGVGDAASARGSQEPTELDCSSPETTVDIVDCLGRDYEAADARLNELYQDKMAALDEQGQALLRAAQRAWMAFRDAECERSRDAARGGTLAAVLGSACMVELTRSRVAELSHEGAESNLATLPQPVFWSAAPPLVERFTCEGFVDAQVGLVPGFDPERGGPSLTARVRIGGEELDFPVDSELQGGVCGPDVSITIEELEAAACPAIRLDDGMCDAVRIYWDADAGEFVRDRR